MHIWLGWLKSGKTSVKVRRKYYLFSIIWCETSIQATFCRYRHFTFTTIIFYPLVAEYWTHIFNIYAEHKSMFKRNKSNMSTVSREKLNFILAKEYVKESQLKQRAEGKLQNTIGNRNEKFRMSEMLFVKWNFQDL